MSWSVYILICPLDNCVRYVGITQHINKRYNNHCLNGWNQKKENSYKYNWINHLKDQNLKPVLKEIHSNLMEEQACKIEVNLISLYRYLVGDKLTNIHKGGNVPPIPRKGIRKYNTDLMKISAQKRFSNPLERQKISKIRIEKGIAKGQNNPMFGKKRSEVGKRNKDLKSKSVCKIQNDSIIEIYSSMKEAALSNNIDRSNIGKCCKDNNKTCGGFKWRLLNE